MAKRTKAQPSREEVFAEKQSAARAAAKDVTAAVTSEILAPVQAAREREAPSVEANEADVLSRARWNLLPSGGKARVLREEREARAVTRRQQAPRASQPQGEGEGEGTATTFADLPPEQFRRAAEAMFEQLGVDAAGVLQQVAEQVEKRAWEREAAKDTTDYSALRGKADDDDDEEDEDADNNDTEY